MVGRHFDLKKKKSSKSDKRVFLQTWEFLDAQYVKNVFIPNFQKLSHCKN